MNTYAESIHIYIPISLPPSVPMQVSQWLHDEKTLEQLSAKAKAASRPASTTDIAAEIGDLLFNHVDTLKRQREMDRERFKVLVDRFRLLERQ